MTTTPENIGTYAGDPVTVRRTDNGRIYVTVGTIEDLEYPIDLNGSLQNWVAARLCSDCGTAFDNGSPISQQVPGTTKCVSCRDMDIQDEAWD